MSEIRIWEEYLQHFGLEQNAIREGCEPYLIVNDELKDNAIVLIHGLTDSPFFMKAIGQYFHDAMGFNVVIPLLAGHGLKQPDGMRTVTLAQWEENVNYAVEAAKNYGNKISIGGLSTGGALSVYKAFKSNGGISGGVFLFSAALDLTSKYGTLGGELEEFLLTLPITNEVADIQDLIRDNSLVGENPYRYAKMDYHGAIQLKKIIREIDKNIEKASLLQPVFAAHSEADERANLEAIKIFLERCSIQESFIIPRHLKVKHGSVVLQDDIPATDVNLRDDKNPCFEEMIKAVHHFAINHLENVKSISVLV